MAELINTSKRAQFVADWTQTTNFAVTGFPARDNWSAGATGTIDAILAPSSLSGGGNPSSFTVYWQETVDQTGFTFQYVNSSGQVILELGGNNPEWEINDGDGSITPYGGDGYDRWIKYEVSFDWGKGEYSYTMEDMQSGHTETGTRSLIYNTDLETFKINNSNWGSADHMWVDDISISGSSFTSETTVGSNTVYGQENGVLVPVNIDGLVGYWPMTQGAGSIAYDESKNGNGGTIYGASWTNTANEKALDFDGVDDYVDCGDDESISLTGSNDDVISISAWFETNTSNQYQRIVRKGEEYGIAINFGSAGNVAVYSFGDNCISGDVGSNDGNWHHIVGIFKEGQEFRLYFDNQEVGTSPCSTNDTSGDTANPVLIGTDNSNFFDGKIDEVRIYDRALSAQEIANIYEKTRNLYGV